MKQVKRMVDFEGKMSSTSSQSLRTVEAAGTTGAIDARWRAPMLGAIVVLGLLVFVFWGFFRYQVRMAIAEQADYGHILVAPFIAGYFIYLNREKLLAEPFRTTWLGFLPIVLGLATYMFFSIGPMRHSNLQSVGVMMTLGGLGLLFCGWRSLAWFWFPLLYLLLFGQVISPRLMHMATFKMQDITARGSFLVMQLAGMDVDRQGNTLTIFHNGELKPLNIAEACSGMRMLMAFLALGVLMAYTGLKRFWQRSTLVLLAVPTAIFINVLRVVTLGVLSLFDTEFAAGDFHSFIGLVWLIPAFLIYLGLMWAITHLVVEAPKEAARS